MIASAVAFCCYEFLNQRLTYTLLYSVAKGDTNDMKHFYTSKACFNFYKMQYFIFATVWGYLSLKPTGWLPWHLGGNLEIG
jgi:hypothetical protein